MSDTHPIEMVDDPVTTDRMLADLRDLGVEAGDTLAVHSSLSALGWVAGGQQAVVEALQRAVTESGTLAMPAHSGHYAGPWTWSNPPLPDDWVEQFPEAMPTYRPSVTQTFGVGTVPECFRQFPETVRSRHPEVSWAAWGADADRIVADHAYDGGLGDGSPLATLYDMDARILLLGVGHEVNTALHLAEHRATFPKEWITRAAPVREDGERVLVEYEGLATSTEDFAAVGAAFEDDVGAAKGTVGVADATLLDHPALVDFAADWFSEHR